MNFSLSKSPYRSLIVSGAGFVLALLFQIMFEIATHVATIESITDLIDLKHSPPLVAGGLVGLVLARLIDTTAQQGRALARTVERIEQLSKTLTSQENAIRMLNDDRTTQFTDVI